MLVSLHSVVEGRLDPGGGRQVLLRLAAAAYLGVRSPCASVLSSLRGNKTQPPPRSGMIIRQEGTPESFLRIATRCTNAGQVCQRV